MKKGNFMQKRQKYCLRAPGATVCNKTKTLVSVSSGEGYIVDPIQTEKYILDSEIPELKNWVAQKNAILLYSSRDCFFFFAHEIILHPTN